MKKSKPRRRYYIKNIKSKQYIILMHKVSFSYNSSANYCTEYLQVYKQNLIKKLGNIHIYNYLVVIYNDKHDVEIKLVYPTIDILNSEFREHLNNTQKRKLKILTVLKNDEKITFDEFKNILK